MGNQSGGLQFDSIGWPILDSRFITFMFSTSGGMKFVILIEDLNSVYCFGWNSGVQREHLTIQDPVTGVNQEN